MALYNTVSREEFEEKVLKNDKVVLVDFWAQWCPPCLAMAPTLETVAQALDKTVDIVKVNIEESPENNALAGESGVRGIPNMVIYKDGVEVDRIVGMVPQDTLMDTLAKAAK